uniref:Ig-like domain-containing protein n=1 Tax=Aquila chrysaetos chrysaetos TaxID=223781 RepID=A0A663DN02_AQUCH
MQLLEDGGGLRAPGETVRLSCRGSGFNFGEYYIWWYRQAAGGSLEWVSYISAYSGTTKQYGAGVQGRATVSRDNSRSESILSLRDLQARDSARYFCAVARGQEIQLSFNTNLLGPGPGCTIEISTSLFTSPPQEAVESNEVTPSGPGHLRPPWPCIPLLLFLASSLQFQWAPLPSATAFFHPSPGDSLPKGTCWSTHQKRGEGRDAESLWRASVEWAMLPQMVVAVKRVTLCQGSVGVPSCGCRGALSSC